jgi:hypothetical protein
LANKQPHVDLNLISPLLFLLLLSNPFVIRDIIRKSNSFPSSLILKRYVDFLNIMAYDFHGKWETKTGHNAPLFPASYESDWRKQLAVVSVLSF